MLTARVDSKGRFEEHLAAFREMLRRSIARGGERSSDNSRDRGANRYPSLILEKQHPRRYIIVVFLGERG